jgi:hypothetical protein
VEDGNVVCGRKKRVVRWTRRKRFQAEQKLDFSFQEINKGHNISGVWWDQKG